MQRTDKARARLMLEQPFFAGILLSTPVKYTTQVPTAAVDDKYMYVNPDFMASLDTVQCEQFVQVHEVSHIAFEHVWRLKDASYDPMLWNMATDYVINAMITEAGMRMPTIKGKRIGLLDPRFTSKMSADEVYRALKKEQDKGGKPKPDDGGWGSDLREPQDMSPEARAQSSMEARQKIAQAAQLAAGKVPASMARLVDQMLNPVLPWRDMLREYMTEVVTDDESWSRRNRRFPDVYLPSRHSEALGEIVCIGDTSGSITNDDLARIAAEVHACASLASPSSVRLVWCDAKVQHEQVFERGDEIHCQPKGGGGTDMRVALKHVEQYDPAVVILITDGHTPWPTTEPPYPLIVCCTTQETVPVGRVIRL